MELNDMMLNSMISKHKVAVVVVPVAVAATSLESMEAKVDRIEDALRLFNQMEDSGLIRGLLNEGQLDLSKDVIDQMTRASVGIILTLHNFSPWWRRFRKMRLRSSLERCLQRVCHQMLRLFGTLIHAYLKVDRIGNALQIFNQMADSGLIRGLLNEDLLDLSKDVIDQIMRASVGITPALHNFMVDSGLIRGLLNKGLLDLSMDLIDGMMRASVGITHALHNFVSKAFGQAGRGEEIERSFVSDNGPNQMLEQQSFVSNRMSRYQKFGWQSRSLEDLIEWPDSSTLVNVMPQITRQSPSGSSLVEGQQQSWHSLRASPTEWPNGQPPVGPSHMQPLWPRVAEQPQPGHYPQEEALQNLSGTLE
ncbi:hypothetical protein ACOSQ2_006726 [Xanthoceras sorbifolium]